MSSTLDNSSFSEIPIVKSWLVPKGEAWLVRDDIRGLILYVFREPPPLSRRQRMIRWLKVQWHKFKDACEV